MDTLKLMKVVKCTAPLEPGISEDEARAYIAAHFAMKDNGLLASLIEIGDDGNPKNLISFWRLSELDSYEHLPKGQTLISIPIQTVELLSQNY
jgi:hypothetical protein